MISMSLFICLFILFWIINLFVIAYVFGPIMRYIFKPLYHKSWGKNYKKYRKELNFNNLFENGIVLMYLFFALPLIFLGFVGFINILFSGNILGLIGALIMLGLGWSLIEHEEHMNKRWKKKKKRK